MNILGIVFLLIALAFFIWQVVALVKDIKLKKLRRNKSKNCNSTLENSNDENNKKE